jgi:hypothetical protein
VLRDAGAAGAGLTGGNDRIRTRLDAYRRVVSNDRDDLRAVALEALRDGSPVRADWRHEGLRRSFRAEGTVVAVTDRADGEGFDVVLEVTPRFGNPTRQPVAGETLVALTPIAR